MCSIRALLCDRKGEKALLVSCLACTACLVLQVLLQAGAMRRSWAQRVGARPDEVPDHVISGLCACATSGWAMRRCWARRVGARCIDCLGKV